MANVLVGQSGGPTAVINASLAGVIEQAQRERARRGADVDRILGMRFAIEGFLEGSHVDLTDLPPDRLERLARTPSSALGSCRYKLTDDDLPSVLDRLRELDVRYLFIIGGNDTMDTIHRIEAYASEHGYELRGIGVPKTVDNDLHGTHHTPGYPSAASYVARSVQQAGRLARDMQRVDQFAIFQTVGREAGWLAAASALARNRPTDPPHLIYVPELRLTPERVLADVERAVRAHGFAYIVAGEGVLWDDGRPVSDTSGTDRFANVEFGAMGGGAAAFTLHRLISGEFGYRGEFQIPESMAMAADDRIVDRDRAEAREAGRQAVRLAVAGESGEMVTLGASQGELGTAPLERVAINAKPMPAEMIRPGDVTDAYLRYGRALIGTMPLYEDVADDWEKQS
ncbi:MAG: diphosphate--fructose-6-phosphate 1-phosphotransferase [Spirochaetota bacterium]